jgi:protein-S-isoprenylcysteine O-methyltransferase Ste14
MSENLLKKIIYRWRVRISLLFVILAVVFSKPELWSLLVGIGLTLAGLLLRTWASGHLEKERELIVTGPYRFTRNPLYLGNLLIGIGVVVGAQSLWILALSLVLFLIFYPVVVYTEKQKMEKLFPEEYAIYKEKVPLFFPALRPSLKGQNIRFQWSQYKQNREYRALIGSAIFWIIITAKFLLDLRF